jgi:hypothetical protein
MEFEQKLANELTNLGIHTQFNFPIPGSKFEVDLYIKAPIRGLIEIKSGSLSSEALIARDKQLKNIYKKFNNSICIFIITLGKEKGRLANNALYDFTSIWYIDVPLEQKKPEMYCAQRIRECFVEETLRLKLRELHLREKEELQLEDSIKQLEAEEKYRENMIKEKKDELDSLIDKSKHPRVREGDFNQKIKNLEHNIDNLQNDKKMRAEQLQVYKYQSESTQVEIKSIYDQIEDLKSEKNADFPSVVDYAGTKKQLSDIGQRLGTKKNVGILSNEQALKLQNTIFTEDSSFKVINIYKVKGQEFKDYFPHLKRWQKPMQVIETDKGWFVDATINNHGATEWEIKEYHNCRVTYSKGGLFKPLWLQKDNVFTRKPIDEDMFGDVLSSFQAFLTKERFKVLQQEVMGFAEEYRSGHYTTAVLRIGRTLEYVVYTLAYSWGITLNKPTMERIDKLNGQFDKLSKHLIYYYTSDESKKSENRTKLIQVFKDTSGVLVDMQTDLDQNKDVKSSKNIVNVDALLRDVKNKYAKNANVRNEVNKLIKLELIQKLYLKRNEAAHADISGLRREFDKEEVKEMSENLNEILFHLGNIHDAISKNSD